MNSILALRQEEPIQEREKPRVPMLRQLTGNPMSDDFIVPVAAKPPLATLL